MTTPSTHDARTIFFHWACAALIIVLWGLGQTIDWFPKDTPRIMARSTHIALGALLAVLLVARLQWRRSGANHLPPAIDGTLGRVATGVHHLLYVLTAAAVVIGIAAVWIRGDNLFNLVQIASIAPDDKVLRRNVVGIHEWLANGLLILAALHAISALWHHFVVKDDVLKRMLACGRK